MKKRALSILTLLITIIAVNSVLSLDITFSKSSYQPQETLQAQITGDFISIKPENIQLYKQDIPREFPVISGFTKQNDVYYFYSILPNQEANYSLKIIGSKYISSGELKSDDITKDFEIKKTNSSYLSINPGFIVTDKDFSIKIKSLNGNSQITAILSAEQTKSISLMQDIEKNLEFSVSNITENTDLKINGYTIPIFINKKSNTTSPIIIQTTDIVFIPSSLEATVSAEKDYFFKILLKNSGQENITGIILSSDLNAVITPSSISQLNANESLTFNITISIPKTENNISGAITSQYQDKISVLPVFFEITTEPSKVNLTGTSIDTLSCFDVGKICLDTQDCNGEKTASSEGPCCLGECIGKKKSSNTLLYGIVLGIFLLLIIAYFYFKIKKKQKLKSTDEMLKEKSKRFSKRMKMDGEEVEGELDRV